jgi:radical SAM protein with 4Fe4S-binding SPASM domain
MPVEDFKEIAVQCKGKVFQFALGGRGDPDLHENFEEILKLCSENGIVPNFTTSGLGMTAEKAEICKKYTGAAAVSWYRSSYTEKAVELLLRAEVKTNIHYVLGNNTIDEALDRLINQGFPEKINAVIFLLHKPVGMGTQDNVLKADNIKVQQFFELIDSRKFDFKIGFDSCSCAGIINFAPNINRSSIDYCEGARFSCYIDAQMNMMPCSFANDNPERHISLRYSTISEAWNSEPFEKFRNHLRNSCKDCSDREYCGGGCPVVNEITLCVRKERKIL